VGDRHAAKNRFFDATSDADGATSRRTRLPRTDRDMTTVPRFSCAILTSQWSVIRSTGTPRNHHARFNQVRRPTRPTQQLRTTDTESPRRRGTALTASSPLRRQHSECVPNTGPGHAGELARDLIRSVAVPSDGPEPRWNPDPQLDPKSRDHDQTQKFARNARAPLQLSVSIVPFAKCIASTSGSGTGAGQRSRTGFGAYRAAKTLRTRR